MRTDLFGIAKKSIAGDAKPVNPATVKAQAQKSHGRFVCPFTLKPDGCEVFTMPDGTAKCVSDNGSWMNSTTIEQLGLSMEKVAHITEVVHKLIAQHGSPAVAAEEYRKYIQTLRANGACTVEDDYVKRVISELRGYAKKAQRVT